MTQQEATGLKNPLTGEYITRSQVFLLHIKYKYYAVLGGFYNDAINYHQHILNDMMILEQEVKNNCDKNNDQQL